MERLFEMASEEHELHPERSDRYVEIARSISTRMRIRIPADLKKMFCKHCGCYLPASGSRVRLQDGVLITTCLKCQGLTRLPYR